MKLDELLGIDRDDPEQQLAKRQVDNDWSLLDDLVAARGRAGLTQREVAERIGVDQSVIARLESRTRDPHLSTLRRYAMAIGVEIRHNVVHSGRERFTHLPWTPGEIAAALNRDSSHLHRHLELADRDPDSYRSALAAIGRSRG